MNNGLKALLIAASTIITCMIVTLGFSMAKEAGKIGNQVTQELTQYQTSVAEQEVMKYDGIVVFGSDVRNLIRKLSGEDSELRVTVTEKQTQRVYSTKEDAARIEDSQSFLYVDPLAEFSGEVLKNKNGIIVEISFRKQTDETE